MGNKLKVRQKLYSEQNGVCLYCGLAMKEGDWNIDHIIPKSRGGKKSIKNQGAVHINCNFLVNNFVSLEELNQHVKNITPLMLAKENVMRERGLIARIPHNGIQSIHPGKN